MRFSSDGEDIGGEGDLAGAHRAVRRAELRALRDAEAARVEGFDGRVLVDLDAEFGAGARERDGQLRGVDEGRVAGAEEVNSPTFEAGLFRTRDSALIHPAKLTVALARACAELGVEIHEHTPVEALDTSSLSVAQGAELRTPYGTVRARKVALATNVFPSLLKRNRLQTVPVYDYVLMTEPLTNAQLASIGWEGRQGLGDSANQFHYYRLSRDNRILWGGYDAIYHYGGRVREEYEDRPETFQRLASHFFTTFPQLEGIRFSNKWAGAIDTCSRFCAFFGSARDGRVAYATGFTGLGVASTHFGAQVMLDLLEGRATERTELAMVKSRTAPLPAGARRIHRHQPDALVARPRRPQRRQAQPLPEDARRRRPRLRLLTRATRPHPATPH